MAEDQRVTIQIDKLAGVSMTLTYPSEWLGEFGSHTVQLAFEQFAFALQTIAAKEKAYGSAWREQGWMGNLARIMSKTARLRNMLWREGPLESDGEPVQDTLLDLINLSVFALLNRQTRNRWGRSDG